jgi:hypothetical protein
MERREAILAEWKNLGQPVLAAGGQTGRNVVAHPLIQMLHQADVLCDRLGRSVRAQRGRPIGAGSAPDRKPEPPRVMLASGGNRDW